MGFASPSLISLKNVAVPLEKPPLPPLVVNPPLTYPLFTPPLKSPLNRPLNPPLTPLINPPNWGVANVSKFSLLKQESEKLETHTWTCPI
eukprot:MONOS_14775.1-p1 / transcript=MONOS_14775.1 / gene=MONOS_14775 / organism=Monocercomonoides_exilis_PA203 / gene_product=unspecified product / transcript_product=unspecified product / location=Mono_scaffold01070:17092-17783(+) / protein_length=90 / sequence_SO=supercontig / SO=protein_coding / is_pseudo=false